MSIIGSNILAGAAGSGVSAYEIEQSLRFDGSSDLTRTPGSAGNRRTWTISTWVKKSNTTTSQQFIIGIPGGAGESLYFQLKLHNDVLKVAGYANTYYRTSELLRDYGAWYHIVIRSDTTSATASERLRVYINGVQSVPDTVSQAITTVSQNFEWALNGSGYINNIGKHQSSEAYFGGYLSETIIVDGTSLHPDNFGEYDDNGVWRPVAYSGSYGTNGIYLKYDPSATNGIGHDHSGNGNNFTPSGFTTSGTGTDVMSDTPTTNWCTLNPLDAGTSGMLSDGNLTYNLASGSDYTVRATQGMSSGKWYAEWTFNSGGNSDVGIASHKASLTGYLGQDQYGYIYYNQNGYKYNNATGASYGATYTHGDVIGIAFDADAGSLIFYKNGTSQGTAYTGLSDFPYFFAVGSNSTNGTFNFGQRDFEYTPPTGFNALNTSNLPAPDIADGSEYFNTVLYSGDGSSTRSLTGVGFQPDFLWLKGRNTNYSHLLYDAVRGAGSYKGLNSNATRAEGSAVGDDSTYGYLNSFDSDGFSVTKGSDATSYTNGASSTYVAWNWLAGGSGSSNTDGDITSTVSANPTAGFSIVTYAGSGTGGDSIGHGLGVPPKMIIAKSRGGGSYPTASWAVYHESIGASKSLALDTTAAAAGPYSNPGTIWYNTTPTSTVFYVGNLNETNGSNNYVAYCFAEVEGYSKFGSYTGNGSDDGPFIFTGHKPAWILVKRSTGVGDWTIYDVKRDTYNIASKDLVPNSGAAEPSVGSIGDILSNGFKIRNQQNVSGQTYIFASFASHPFGGSGVSPATAR